MINQLNFILHKESKFIALTVIGLLLLIGLAFGWKKRSIIIDTYRYLNYPPQSPAQRGDGTEATNLKFFNPMGLAEDRDGNIYIVDRGRGDLQGGVIWQVNPRGQGKAIAGTGKKGERGIIFPNTRALDTNLYSPENLAFDSKDRLHIIDHINRVIWRLESDGELTRVAGTGQGNYSGDGGPALNATFNKPYDIKFDSQDNLYIADTLNHRVRKIAPDGTITTVVGTGEAGYSGDGGQAIKAQLNTPYNILIDPQDRLLIADSLNHVIRRVDSNGTITTIAGVGEAGYAGDGGHALSAKFDTPQALFMDDKNILYVGDEHNHAIRAILPNGTITTVIGNGKPGFTPEQTPVSQALLNDPETMIIRQDGSMLIVDGDNGRVLIVGKNDLVRVFAGRKWKCKSSDYKKFYKFSRALGSGHLSCQP